MKKTVIDQAYLDKTLPKMPERFETETRALLRALAAARREEIPMKRKSVPALAIALALLLALAGIAVAGRLGLLDFITTYNPNSKTDVEGMIHTDFAMEGEPMESVIVDARQAFFDGRSAHFLVGFRPKAENTSLVWLAREDVVLPDRVDEARLHGDTALGIVLHASVPDTNAAHDFGMRQRSLRDGAAEQVAFGYVLPDTFQTDELPVVLTVRVFDVETKKTIEEGRFALTIPRTAQPETVTFLLDRDLESVHMNEIKIAYTPVEMSVIVRCLPRWQDHYPTIGLLDADGYVSATGATLLGEGLEENEELYQVLYPAPDAMPETVALWVYDTDEALVLHTRTGEATLHPAKAAFSKEIPRLDFGMAYPGAGLIKVEYDPEVILE